MNKNGEARPGQTPCEKCRSGESSSVDSDGLHVCRRCASGKTASAERRFPLGAAAAIAAIEILDSHDPE